LHSVRLYLRAAAGLCAHAEKPALAMGAGDLDQYLRRRPGQRASLTRFIGWLKRRHGLVTLTLPHARRPDQVAREKALLSRTTILVSRLEAARTAPRGRALLAEAIARLYGMPLKAVLMLREDEVDRSDQIVLWRGGEEVALDPPIAAAFRRWVPPATGAFVFPSRDGTGALSTSAVTHHVRAPAK
jgi:hypothetical protein